jgi:hypothetical protein
MIDWLHGLIGWLVWLVGWLPGLLVRLVCLIE